ncbi:MAG TPA: zinc-binding alcohol dehydrogenase [Saprospiraceae bacterium]|nr:zinc-binding alcohol dehydrogenase [Saprospiraceae bacterium]HNT20337.1 zinc-binding alcohol dehydrogenase [Saprospiraceae bacterium]
MPVSRSLWHTDDTHSEIRSQELDLQAGHQLLRSLYSLISLGTEKTIALGGVPPRIFDRMEVPYMEGSFSFPVKYGYSLVAVAEDGRCYHLMHPHQDRVPVLPESLTLLPSGIPPARATLISNMETALTAYWDAEPVKKEKILVAGFGLLGALVALLLRLKGFEEITVFEPDPLRSGMARSLGFPSGDPGFDPGPFDLAFHSSGNPTGLQSCLEVMGIEGRIIELSWYGFQKSTLALGEYFHTRRLRILASQVSSIPRKMAGEWNFARRKQEVLALLADSCWDKLEIEEGPFENSPALFDKIRLSQTKGLTYMLKY